MKSKVIVFVGEFICLVHCHIPELITAKICMAGFQKLAFQMVNENKESGIVKLQFVCVGSGVSERMGHSSAHCNK